MTRKQTPDDVSKSVVSFLKDQLGRALTEDIQSGVINIIGSKKKGGFKDPNRPKRGNSAYIYFCAEHREQVKEEDPELGGEGRDLASGSLVGQSQAGSQADPEIRRPRRGGQGPVQIGDGSLCPTTRASQERRQRSKPTQACKVGVSLLLRRQSRKHHEEEP